MRIKKEQERQQDKLRYISELKKEPNREMRDFFICGIKNLMVLKYENNLKRDVTQKLKEQHKKETIKSLSHICVVSSHDISNILSDKPENVKNLNNKLKKIYVGLNYGR